MSTTKSKGSSERGTGPWWLLQLERAKRFRDRYSCRSRWDDIDKYYRHDFGEGAEKKPNFNLVYMLGRALLPTLVYDHPRIINTPRRPEYLPWASFFDSVDNWLVKEMEIAEIMKDAVLTAYLCNVAPLQVGYDFPISANPLKKQKRVRSLEEDVDDIMGWGDIKGNVNRSRRVNFPWIDQMHPGLFLIPYKTKNMRDCRWEAKFIAKPTRWIKEQPGVIKANCIPTHSATECVKGTELEDLLRETGDLENYTCFWEIHDAEEREWFWMCEDGVFLTLPERDKLQVDGLPSTILSFNKNLKSIWGTPDAIYIEGQMLDGNETRQAGLKQRRVALIKGLIDQNLISEDEMEKLYSDDALPFVRVKNLGDKKLTEAIALLQPHIQQEFFPYQEKCYEDAQRILGFGANQLGTFAPGRRTKYEAQVVEDTNMIRTSERRSLVANCISDIFRKVNQLVIRHWSAPLVMRVVGVDGAMYWVKGRPEELRNLKAELSTDTDVESMAPASSQRTKDEIMQVLQVLGRMPNANTVPMLRQLLSKFPWADVNEILPQAVQGAAMSMPQFQQQQQALMQGSPEALGNTIKGNLQPMLQMAAKSKKKAA